MKISELHLEQTTLTCFKNLINGPKTVQCKALKGKNIAIGIIPF